jgi:hypothetical protein
MYRTQRLLRNVDALACVLSRHACASVHPAAQSALGFAALSRHQQTHFTAIADASLVQGQQPNRYLLAALAITCLPLIPPARAVHQTHMKECSFAYRFQLIEILQLPSETGSGDGPEHP